MHQDMVTNLGRTKQELEQEDRKVVNNWLGFTLIGISATFLVFYLFFLIHSLQLQSHLEGAKMENKKLIAQKEKVDEGKRVTG